jgi:multiple sugar transport system substrate-binding protein
MHKTIVGLLAGLGGALAGVVPVHTESSEKLTILWAEWDPANYLQELVNGYEKETGVKVTIETTAWPGFQYKAYSEFIAKSDTYDMIVGDSQWLGTGATDGHYVELTDFFKAHDLVKVMAPAAVKYYAEYPGNSGRYWAIPLEGDAVGWAYRKDWFEDPKEKSAFQARYGYDLDVPKTFKELRDIAEFFYRPDQKKYGVAIYTNSNGDGLVGGFETVLFSYGGELGDYSTYKVDGIVNSDRAAAALDAYRELYKFTPPDWGGADFVDDNLAITGNLAAMSMNFFAAFPSLLNEASNPNARNTGFFANPQGPDGHQSSALGGQGISIISYSKKRAEAFKFLEWLVKDETQKRWAELGGNTCDAAVLKSDAFQNATPYNRAFYQTMFRVKDFWAVPEYGELLQQFNDRVYPYVTGEPGTAKATLDAVAADWDATFKKYGRQ